ncbi:hypothetical protein C8N36_12022 [Pelagimonas varians]|uniref:Uncharacterized protein n=1 Tax=Pelagimonas varians TaxID=696760 RepID=A0A238L279_9RHOB|nr:hypothetical protein C8N36_12022 [Pelagimonas varians]SMX49058.1 hypothetical protein PEV8663_04077 [Pelagimonas varians]
MHGRGDFEAIPTQPFVILIGPIPAATLGVMGAGFDTSLSAAFLWVERRPSG